MDDARRAMAILEMKADMAKDKQREAINEGS